LKEKYIRVFNGQEWITKCRNNIINILFIAKVKILLKKYEEYKNTDKFKQYVTNRKGLEKLFECYVDDTDERIIYIKEEINLNIYNDRHIPINNYKNII